MPDLDPTQLPLHDLRSMRADLQALDDVVSYVRRVAQARLDLIDAELVHRGAHDGTTITAELPTVLGHHLTGGPARPPRPTDVASDHPIAQDFEARCARLGIADLEALDDGELQRLRDEISEFEHEQSAERRQIFARIDALSAELVRRYRDGEADVDGLLAEG